MRLSNGTFEGIKVGFDDGLSDGVRVGLNDGLLDGVRVGFDDGLLLGEHFNTSLFNNTFEYSFVPAALIL